MAFTTYPKPATPLDGVPSVGPRPLRPLAAPSSSPDIRLDPDWVVRNAARSFNALYTRTTHVIPAAAPRTYSDGLKIRDVPGETKEARKERLLKLAGELLERKQALERGEHVKGVRVEDGTGLVNVLDRYVSKDRDEGGLTLFLAHANGFPKRIWEPTLYHLLSPQGGEPWISEVWSFEAVNHGDSAWLNEGKLGDIFEWADNARDILNFLIHYMPEDSREPEELPMVLTPAPSDVAEKRRTDGHAGRRLVGIGHSFGGCSLAKVGLQVPTLFSGIILVDPVVVPNLGIDSNERLHIGAAIRRDSWASKAEAHRTFSKNPFFQAWDPRALDVYVEEGIRDDTSGAVRLKQSGLQEACTFADRYLRKEVWELIPNLDDGIPLKWIMAGKQPEVTGSEEITQHTVWQRERNTSNVRIPGAGHLIAHERPEELSIAIKSFLEETFDAQRRSKL